MACHRPDLARVDDPAVRLEADVKTLRSRLPAPPPPVANPYLVLMCGLPGAGKTHFALRLAAEMPLQMIESDAARKALMVVPAYNAEENLRVFAACRRLMDELLDNGVPVLLDATNVTERDRAYSYTAAEGRGAEVVVVRVKAPESEVRRRLRRRERGLSKDGASNAGWDVYLKMKAREEPVARPHYVVDTSKDITPAIVKISNKLKVINGD